MTATFLPLSTYARRLHEGLFFTRKKGKGSLNIVFLPVDLSLLFFFIKVASMVNHKLISSQKNIR